MWRLFLSPSPYKPILAILGMWYPANANRVNRIFFPCIHASARAPKHQYKKAPAGCTAKASVKKISLFIDAHKVAACVAPG